MSVVKKMVLEAWTIPYDIFNLVLSLASNGLEIARSIYAPIITLAILPAHIAVTCFLDWQAVKSGALVDSIIKLLLGDYFADFLANPIGALYVRDIELSYLTIIITQITAALYIYEAYNV